MQQKNRILIPDSMWKGTDENKTPQKFINWPNKTTYVTIFYEKRDLLTDSLHLVCSRILQITKMGCCGNCHVLFSLLRRKRERKKKPSKYILKHKYSMNFYCSLHPKRTNLLTEVLFFHNLKNGFAFCCLQFYYIYYQFMQMGKKKIYWYIKEMDTDCLSHRNVIRPLSFIASPLLSLTALLANLTLLMYQIYAWYSKEYTESSILKASARTGLFFWTENKVKIQIGDD